MKKYLSALLFFFTQVYCSNLSFAQDLTSLPEMVLIKGVFFSMGSTNDEGEADEHPLHTIFLDDFFIGKYEVTVREFEKFINESGYKTDCEKRGYSYTYREKGVEEWKGITWKHDEKGDLRPSSDYNHPVIHVTWNDAMAYCEWLSAKTGMEYHLPTEAQWEYAARCGLKEYKYSWGNGNPEGKKGGNICDESFNRRYGPLDKDKYWKSYDDYYPLSAPVGMFDPNDFGVYDMTGNVWEWCWDWYSDKFYEKCNNNSEVRNPQGPSTGDYKVLRGGAFSYLPIYLRSAYRLRDNPGFSDHGYGFRIARTY